MNWSVTQIFGNSLSRFKYLISVAFDQEELAESAVECLLDGPRHRTTAILSVGNVDHGYRDEQRQPDQIQSVAVEKHCNNEDKRK